LTASQESKTFDRGRKPWVWSLVALAVVAALTAWLWRGTRSVERQAAVRPESSVSATVRGSKAAPGGQARSEIVGIVTDHAGTAVPASILAVRAGTLSAEAPRWIAETGPDGSFALSGLEPGRYEVWAWSADGYGAVTSCEVTNGPTSVKLRLEQAGAKAQGTVRDVAGGTVASAEIRAMHANAGLDQTVALAKTDGDGRYRLRLPPGNYLVRVSASGYALTQAVLQIGGQGTEQDFVLNPAAAIAGRVVRADGSRTRGASLTLRPARLDTIQAQWPRVFKADPSGAFSERDVAPGSYLLFAEAEGASAAFGPFDLEAGEERAGLELTLSPGQTLRVELVSDRGVPIEEATVAMKQTDSGIPSRDVSVQSDVRGVAEARGLHAGHTTVIVADHREYEQRVEPVGPLAPSAEPRVVRLTLRSATRLTGHVLSANGTPVPGARVSVEARQRADATYASTLSDERGGFELRVGLGEAAAPSVVVQARHPKQGLARVAVTDPGRPLTMTLSPGLYVKVAVRDERGAPVPFARVTASQVEPLVRGSETMEIGDAEGSCRIGPFEPGAVSVELRGAVLSEPSSRARALVRLRDGGDGSASLIAPPRESRISGRVLGPQGEPLPGVTLLVAPERFGNAARTEGMPVVTDGQGSFLCEGLGAGSHRVFVEALGYAAADRVVMAPGSVELRLEFAGNLHLVRR
jgi:hypothetical protein